MRQSNSLKLLSNWYGQFAILIGTLALFSACGLIQPAPETEEKNDAADTSIEANEVERLTESDFAIFIGRKSGLITYLGPNGNIFTINQAGRNNVSITSDSNLEQFEDLSRAPDAVYYLLPTWTTSGRKLAFAQHQITDTRDQDFAQVPNLISNSQTGMFSIGYSPAQPLARPEQQNGRTSIYTIFSADADGENQQTLWTGTARPIYMYWAPDGETLSVLLQEPGGSELQFALLKAGDSESNQETFQIIDVGGPLYWDWAPHTNQILTHIGSVPPTERVSLLSLESQVIEEILDLEPARFASPDISPDGRLVMLPLQSDVADDDDTWVTIIDLTTRNKSVVDRLDGDLFVGGAFSPDNSMIAYIASTGTAEGELAIYTLENGNLVISQSKKLLAFFWSPDSSKIAAFGVVPSDEDSNSGRPTLSVQIIDVQSEGVTELFSSFETTSQFTEVLTFYSQYQRSATIWSPDSQNIVFPVRTRDGPMVITMDVSGTIHPRTLAPGVLAFWSAD
ncbi:MAG: hypothetical protein AB8G95_22310 [Anaerolineae bacterium]